MLILRLRYKNRHARTHTHIYAQSMHISIIVTLHYHNVSENYSIITVDLFCHCAYFHNLEILYVYI